VIQRVGLRHHRQRQGQRNEGQGGVFAKVHGQGSLKKGLPATLCRGMPDGMTMTLETSLQQDSVQQMTSRSLAGVAK
jgi:hypothetical protein